MKNKTKIAVVGIGLMGSQHLIAIKNLEKELKVKAKKRYLPMQKGDVYSTLSNSHLLKKITGYNPKTSYKTGIKKFVNWYLDYYS